MEQTNRELAPQEAIVTKLEYKGIPGELRQREVKESVIDAQIERLVKRFGCASAQQLVEVVEGYQSLDEMKAELRQVKQWQYAQQEQTALQDRLMTAAALRMQLTLPVQALQQRADASYQAEVEACLAKHTTIAAYLECLKKTAEQFKQELFAKEELAFRKAVLVYQVAKHEDITISSQEIEAEYQALASGRGVSLQEAKRGLTEQTVAFALTVRKVREVLVQYAALANH